SADDANETLTATQAAEGLGGCRSVPNPSSGSRRIYEIYYDSYGCRVPLRYGRHDYSTGRGYGYYHILARRGKWTDFMRNLTRNAVAGVFQRADSPTSRVKCYNYTVSAQPGKPNERTWRVVIEYGSDFQGIITAYWKAGHYNC
ncbi:MAG: hypothetical protein M3271_08445, partial [Actinomycetota bacterium]|nr:hypothetical protein [Actinomycetota bacterium]